MGCFESRIEGRQGSIRFQKKEEFQLETLNPYVAIDCSADSFDGKIKAAEVYAKQRIPNAQFLKQN
jgi:hypothetical protein